MKLPPELRTIIELGPMTHLITINADGMSPEAAFPAPRKSGYIVRYSIEHIGGVGPCSSKSD